MPVYDMECRDCNHTFEVFQKISDEPCSVCEKCNGSARRVILTCPHTQVKNMVTVGQLADRNWERMGHYEKQEKAEADGTNDALKRRDKNALDAKLKRATPAQQKKYVETGEI